MASSPGVVISVEQGMGWKKLLEAASESINDHIPLRNDYLMAENRILRNQIEGRVQLTDCERKELAEIGAKRFGVSRRVDVVAWRGGVGKSGELVG